MTREEFQPYIDLYTDKNGFICEKKGQKHTGNGVLFSAELMLLLKQKGWLTKADKEAYSKHVRKCFINEMLYRAPNLLDKQESVDNHLGLALGSMICDKSLAAQILEWGRTNKVTKKIGPIPIKVPYVFNNLEPGTWSDKAWIGRQPQVIGALKLAAGEELDTIQQAACAAAITQSIITRTAEERTAEGQTHQNDDYKILGFILLTILDEKCGDEKWVKALKATWLTRIKGQFSGPNALFEAYFKQKDHPLAFGWGSDWF